MWCVGVVSNGGGEGRGGEGREGKGKEPDDGQGRRRLVACEATTLISQASRVYRRYVDYLNE